jgi:hypothetical protein
MLKSELAKELGLGALKFVILEEVLKPIKISGIDGNPEQHFIRVIREIQEALKHLKKPANYPVRIFPGLCEGTISIARRRTMLKNLYIQMIGRAKRSRPAPYKPNSCYKFIDPQTGEDIGFIHTDETGQLRMESVLELRFNAGFKDFIVPPNEGAYAILPEGDIDLETGGGMYRLPLSPVCNECLQPVNEWERPKKDGDDTEEHF